MDDYEEGKPLHLIAVTHDITKEDVQQIVNELSYFRKNRHKFVSSQVKLSAKICHYCTANAVIYQWDKWLCFKHWKIERDKEEKKEKEYKEKFAVQ